MDNAMDADPILEALRVAKADLRALIIKTTNRCNLACAHCAPASHKGEVHHTSQAYLSDAIRQFAELGGTTVIFGGGEPFTRPDLFDLVDLCDTLGLSINIETNATLITDKAVRRLAGKRLVIVLSLDGASAAVHDEFRRVPGSFHLTMEAMRRMRQAGIRHRVTTVLNRSNAGELPALIRACLDDWDVDHRLLPVLADGGRGAQADARALAFTHAEILAYLHQQYLPLYREYTGRGQRHRMMVDLPRAILPEEIDTFSSCAWGRTMVGISHDGEVSLCHYVTTEAPYTMGRLSATRTLKDIWFDSPQFQAIRAVDEHTLTGVCGNCRFARSCRGLCRLSAYQTYGDIHAPYPVCQEFFEAGLFPPASMVTVPPGYVDRRDA